MAEQRSTTKPAPDGYARQAKLLASAVQRLRGWVGSDPSREPELADALVALTEHRLLGHGYADAATDAQDSVRRAGQLMTASGPIGPYSAIPDAARYLTAVVHLATLQTAAGLPEAAARLIESLHDLRQQLGGRGLEEALTLPTAIWLLAVPAHAALAAGDPAAATVYADGALARLAASGRASDPDLTYLAIDLDRLGSDCAWAAGRTGDALGPLHAAKDRYDALVAGRLDQPARLSPALLERLAEPLFSLYRDLADRLARIGEVDLALDVRRELVERLRVLADRHGDAGRLRLASTLADLADDLLLADRVDEAQSAAAEAATVRLSGTGAEAARLLVAAVGARALARSRRGADAVTALRPVLSAEEGRPPSAARLVGLAALAEAQRSAGDEDAALASEHAFDDLARDLLGLAAGRDAAVAAARDRARGVVSRGEPVAVAAPSAEEREAAAWLEAEREEAHRRELERQHRAQQEAELQDAERREAERVAAEQQAAERARAEEARQLEAERAAAEAEAERLEVKRRREERLEAHRLEVEQREAERQAAERAELSEQEVILAQQAWREARDRGDRRAARAANERLVEMLRPRAETDPTGYGPRLQYALEELARARLRAGDLRGSRAAAREAKVLDRDLGR